MNRKYNNWPKYLLQWGTLAAIIFFLSGLAVKLFTKMDAPDPETYCPMGGLQAFTTYMVRGSLPCSMSSLQIMMGLALAAAVILFSKLFCGYLCPVGTVEDLLIKLRKALKIKEINIKSGSIADKALRLVKYLLLFWIFYMTATESELFCKNLDPYYAVATGFKGEITLWMSIVTVSIVILGGLFIRRFWCRYICPLGAASNGLKFWLEMLALFLFWWILSLCGVNLSWLILLAAFCIIGWSLEVFSRPHFQVLNIIKDDEACNHCGLCTAKCPCGVNLKDISGRLNSVDCTLCGECLAACNKNALRIGVKSDRPASADGSKKRCSGKYIPAILTVLLFIAALLAGSNFELPTIDEQWGVTEDMKLETVKIENLKSVKCFGSSMAFKARMEKVRGVHGVRTYVGTHTVEISFDPTATTAEKVQGEVFVPSHFRIWSPDPEKLKELKVVTIRTEKMYDKMDLNYLGLQFRTTGKSIFGLESEYNCPLIVRVYISPEENLDEEWFREVVSRKVLAMPVHGGGVKETPVDFTFIKMEKEESRIGIAEYLEMMFDPFTAEYSGQYVNAPGDTIIEKRALHYEGQPQFIYEVTDQNYEKPIIKRSLPYLSNHLSKEEGVIGTYLRLNKNLKPSIQIRFAAPMTAERIWELMTMETWTITYSKSDVREEGARMTFDEPGTTYPYEPKE